MLWIGGPLSTMETLSMVSFLANGHRVYLYTFGDTKNVPDGVDIRDGNEILSFEKAFRNSNEGIGSGGYAGFSDWFRYELLSKRRGFWVDTDMVCLKPLKLVQPNIVATSREGQWGTPALGCVLRLEQDNPLLKFCLEFCRSHSVADLVKESYIAVGPALLQRGIRELNLAQHQVSPDVFCPISWRHTKFMSKPAPARWIYNLKRRLRGGEYVEDIKPETLAVHFWQSTWKISGLDVDGKYHAFSLYEKLKMRYL